MLLLLVDVAYANKVFTGLMQHFITGELEFGVLVLLTNAFKAICKDCNMLDLSN